MASGWNLWVWLVGVVVRRYRDILTIIISFPYSTCISSIFSSCIPTSLFIFKMLFSVLFMLFLCNIANVAQRIFEIVQKLRSCEHGNIINYIDKNVERTSVHCACAQGPRFPCAK